MKKTLGAKTIVMSTPTWVVGSFDSQGKPNIMTAAWAGVCCSQPPCLAVSIRKSRHTYEGIAFNKAFTVNVPSEDHIEAFDLCGTFSGSKVDKFKETGLTPISSDLVEAPYVQEFPLVLECKLVHMFELGIHVQFVGEIIDVKADEQVLGEDGYPDILKVRPVVYVPGAMAYYRIGSKLGRGFHTKKK